MNYTRMTTAQALVRFLDNQYVEFDGVETKFVEGIFTIFGHGIAVGLGQALDENPRGLKVFQGRNEQGAYKIHCKYYDDGNYDCNYKIIDAGMSSYCGGKILVKGNCKNLVVKKNEGKNYAD